MLNESEVLAYLLSRWRKNDVFYMYMFKALESTPPPLLYHFIPLYPTFLIIISIIIFFSHSFSIFLPISLKIEAFLPECIKARLRPVIARLPFCRTCQVQGLRSFKALRSGMLYVCKINTDRVSDPDKKKR